jgi:hypothetical protein
VTDPDNKNTDPNTDNSSAGGAGSSDGSSSSNSGSSGSSGSGSSGSSSSSSSQTNGSTNIYNGTGAVGPDGLMIKENDIVALEQPANVSDTLAKTGGFVGTLVGYLAAIAIMAFGMLLVFGDRKRVK